MKKLFCILMALTMMTVALVSCSDGKEETTAPVVTIPTETTVVPGTDSTTAAPVVPTETTTTKQEIVLLDPESVDNKDYGYYVRYMRNAEKEIIGVMAQAWKMTDATENIVIDSEYKVRDNKTGELTVYPVLEVGNGSGFVSFGKQLKSVTIPGSVRKINKVAFSVCDEMETLTLSEGLESIGEMAFWKCKSLKTLVIPSTVTEIGKAAFNDCTALTSVTLPRAFESQVDNIFGGCPNVQFTFVD